MNIQIIAEHSVDVDLLTGGVVIDAGCRGFQFSEAMRDLGCEVLAFDVEDMAPPPGIKFIKKALRYISGTCFYVDTKDQQGKFIGADGIEIEGCGINELYEQIGTSGKQVDVLKLDIEGSEYTVLSDVFFKPIPKQISVEFHMHCHRGLHDLYYQACMDNLLKYYVPVSHELTQAHGAGFNYWNSLFIRKDLL